MPRKPGLIQLPLFSAGIIYQLLPVIGQIHPPKKRLMQRVAFIWLFGWLPLLLLSLFFDSPTENPALPFYIDFSVHIRFLLVAPIFVFADLIVEPGLGRLVGHLWKGQLIAREDLPKFRIYLRRARKLARSRIADVIILLLVVVLAIMGLHSLVPVDVSNWVTGKMGVKSELSPAGWWFAYISTPIYQLLVLNWIWRFGIWSVFLARIAGLNLQLNSLHPDHAGGLGFIGQYTLLFSPFVIGFGISYSSILATRIVFEEATLVSLVPEIAIYLVMVLMFITVPSFFFIVTMSRVRTRGVLVISDLSRYYVDMFTKKWITSPGDYNDSMLGTEDIQSLSALQGNFDTVKAMRINPLDLFALLTLLGAAICPFLPLVFTIYSPRELLQVLADSLL